MQPVKKVIYIRGFTMVEMIIVIVVIGAIFAVGALVLGRAFESYALTQKTTDVDWQGRVAMERMVRELRQIRSATPSDLVFSGTEIRFNDIDANPVCFRLSGTTLQRDTEGPAAACGSVNPPDPQPLADNVVATTGLNFYYYQQDGSVAISADQVYYITVRLAVSENTNTIGSINETYRVTIQPRRF